MTIAALLLGLAALALRPVSAHAVVVTAAAGIAGIVAAVPPVADRRVARRRWAAVVALGVGAFVVVPVGAGPPPEPARLAAAVAGVVAAVAEEAFFRRFVYGRLARFGDALAVAVSAVAFALVHVPVHGWRVVPIDLAAGVLFGWQRWTTGGWSAPAVTHAAANLIQMG